jgi:hypothetical protein
VTGSNEHAETAPLLIKKFIIDMWQCGKMTGNMTSKEKL